jgi:hypothetical protein
LLFQGSAGFGIDHAPSMSLFGLAGSTGAALDGTFCSQPSIEDVELAEGEIVLAAGMGFDASARPKEAALVGGGGSQGSAGFDQRSFLGCGCGGAAAGIPQGSTCAGLAMLEAPKEMSSKSTSALSGFFSVFLKSCSL